MDPAVIRRLSPPASNVVPTHAPAVTGLGFSTQYDLDLTVLDPTGTSGNELALPAFTVTELDLTAAAIEALIGRDVLARCVLEYNGPANSFSLTY